jgi:hypothetical protein
VCNGQQPVGSGALILSAQALCNTTGIAATVPLHLGAVDVDVDDQYIDLHRADVWWSTMDIGEQSTMKAPPIG